MFDYNVCKKLLFVLVAFIFLFGFVNAACTTLEYKGLFVPVANSSVQNYVQQLSKFDNLAGNYSTIYSCYSKSADCTPIYKEYIMNNDPSGSITNNLSCKLLNSSEIAEITISNPLVECVFATTGSNIQTKKCFYYKNTDAKGIVCKYLLDKDADLKAVIKSENINFNSDSCISTIDYLAIIDNKLIEPDSKTQVVINNTQVGNVNVCFDSFYKSTNLESNTTLEKVSSVSQANIVCYYNNSNLNGYDCATFIKDQVNTVISEPVKEYFNLQANSESICFNKNDSPKFFSYLTSNVLKSKIVIAKTAVASTKSNVSKDNYIYLNNYLKASFLNQSIALDSQKQLVELHKFKRDIDYLSLESSITKETAKGNTLLLKLVDSREKARIDLINLIPKLDLQNSTLTDLYYNQLNSDVKTKVTKNAGINSSLAKYFANIKKYGDSYNLETQNVSQTDDYVDTNSTIYSSDVIDDSGDLSTNAIDLDPSVAAVNKSSVQFRDASNYLIKKELIPITKIRDAKNILSDKLKIDYTYFKDYKTIGQYGDNRKYFGFVVLHDGGSWTGCNTKYELNSYDNEKCAARSALSLWKSRNAISTHYYIGCNGTIFLFVPETNVAWHAGGPNSIVDINPISIGVDFRNCFKNSGSPYTSEQINAAEDLLVDFQTRGLIKEISNNTVIAHFEINKMKNDPLPGFNWYGLLLQDVRKIVKINKSKSPFLVSLYTVKSNTDNIA